MVREKMICRVCGKEYEPCRSAKKDSKVFHWQEVACSPECGAIYLEKINKSRCNTASSSEHSYKDAQVETVGVNNIQSPNDKEDVTEFYTDSPAYNLN